MNAPLQIQAQHRDIVPAFWLAVKALFSERFSQNQSVCDAHGRDESAYPPTPPQAVVYAKNLDEVSALLKLANQYKVPVITYGAGSSLEGHLLAVQGGVCLDMSLMNQVLTVYADDLQIRVQAGVTRKQVNEAVKHLGLFFPIDPGADASIGGMCATRASGTNAVRYGTMLDNVLGMTVVTAEGEIAHLGGRAKKSSAGYDLTRLFIGSEGTLGVIGEITLKLYPLPASVMAATCVFADVQSAVQCVMQVIQSGIPIARSELMDAATVRAVNRHSKLSLPEQPTLLFEFHGSQAGVQEQVDWVQEIAKDSGGANFAWASTPEERTRLWSARHQAYFALLNSRPGCRVVTTDVCVPISQLANCVDFAIQDIAQAQMQAGILGHVGDGNFHVAYLIDPQSTQELQTAERLNARLVHHALSLGGTCTGEHGIGLHKRGFLLQEAGVQALDLMQKIKASLDPNNIMNPGKILLDAAEMNIR